MDSPHVQESGDDKTLDEHSEGEEWSESCISMNLYDDGNVRMLRNKLCTKENSNKKIKENFSWHKREPPVVDSTFHGKEFPDELLPEISPYMHLKQFFDDDLTKQYCRSN